MWSTHLSVIFHISHHLGHRILGRDGDQHMHMVGLQVSFQHSPLLLSESSNSCGPPAKPGVYPREITAFQRATCAGRLTVPTRPKVTSKRSTEPHGQKFIYIPTKNAPILPQRAPRTGNATMKIPEIANAKPGNANLN